MDNNSASAGPFDRDYLEKLQNIKSNIAKYPDFPKPGILFRDVFPLFYNPKLLEDVIDVFEHHLRSLNCTIGAIVGLESRGFLIGPMLALKLSVPFIPIRKAGKLPGKIKSAEYQLEYGSDKFEIQMDSVTPGLNCVIVDDLLATGGSLETASSLIEQCGGKVVDSAVIIELSDLKGRDKIKSPVFSLVQY